MNLTKRRSAEIARSLETARGLSGGFWCLSDGLKVNGSRIGSQGLNEVLPERGRGHRAAWPVTATDSSVRG